MPRVGTGSVIPKTLTDGTCAYELRFHARGRRESVTLHERAPCDYGCGGGWDERSARRELGNIVARVRAGVWTREAPHPRVAAQAAAAARPIPTFHEYASYWLQARTGGVLGDKPIEENTRRDYLWRLAGICCRSSRPAGRRLVRASTRSAVIGHLVTGAVLCLTIIGIPLGRSACGRAGRSASHGDRGGPLRR